MHSCLTRLYGTTVVAILLAAPYTMADTFAWTNSLGGTFSVAGNWTVVPPDTGTPPPGTGDAALFNQVGTYTVTFTADASATCWN